MQETTAVSEDLSREAIALDRFVEFRASVRNICVRELKEAKKRKKDSANGVSADADAAAALNSFLSETLSSCDSVRSSLLTDAGVVVSDAPAATNAGNLWHLVDRHPKSGEKI
jgi:hypothetical protein